MRHACAILAAWIIWAHSWSPPKFDRWEAGNVVDNETMCYEVMRDSVENLVRKWKDEMSGIATVTQDGTMVTVTMPHGDVIFINLVCLPDIVDPRGAKGK